MEIQLQELIDQIKKDGVEAAETEAEAIVKAAKEKAEQIIADAQANADKILAGARTEAERMAKSSEDAIRQAGRNLLISFRESVTRELNAIIGENVTAVYSSDAFAGLIISVVENWANKPDAEDIAVILNTQDLNELEENLLAALKEKMLKGITLKANDNFDGGFRIAVRGGSAYYDYSAEAVVDMLSNYLSPKVTELLKEAK
ncbi:MAG: V-type ATP synthase subunit E [Clostridia bacterium]|nr:V-type ATP synthase subunit E [Clostridia bacterium]MBQ3562860.1 V-type ATP synthase subunit E [Clostridia bacterium]